MKHYSNIFFLKIFFAIKLLSSVLIILFPQALLMVLYPFATISPLFVAAVAYGNIQKWLLLLSLIIVFVLVVFFAVTSVCIIVKSKVHKSIIYILITFFIIEVVSFFLSLTYGTLAIGKLIGIVFNIVIIKLLWGCRTHRETRKTGDG